MPSRGPIGPVAVPKMSRTVVETELAPNPTHGAKAAVPGLLPEVAGGDPDALCRLAAGPALRLGELVAEADPARAARVAEALEDARNSGRLIGETLVEKGVLSPAELATLLRFQRHQRREAPTDERFRLGRILVAQGRITDEQLREALARQREIGQPLGEHLIAQGRISPEDLHTALRTQHRLVTLALVAALAMTGAADADAGVGAGAGADQARQSASQSADFRIRIPPVMRMQILQQPASIEITGLDVERGYVEVPSGSLLKVTANTTWEVTFRPRSGFARSARVSGLAGDLVVGEAGGSLAGLRPMPRATMFDLSYRFELAAGVKPGSHPWPLSIEAHAL